MFDVDLKKLKQNKRFLLGGIFVVLLFLILPLFLKAGPSSMEESDLEESGESNIHKLVMNEVMSSNGGAYLSSDGNIYDWIELYNGKNKAISLKNYGLTDNENTIKWVFPDVVIEPHSYMIISLSGTNQEGLYAPFKLKSSGGEVLALKNANGKVIDAIETVALKKNQVFARNLKGEWVISSMPTPGFINTKEGFEEYQASLKGESSIKISEVLPRNKGNFKNQDGKYSGYIEITNIGEESVSIKNYSLSNSKTVPFKYQLPDITLKKGEVYVVYTDSYEGEETYTGFKLESETGVAILTDNKGKIIDQVEYEHLENGLGLVLQGETFYESNGLSPGYSNTNDGVSAHLKKHSKNPSTLMINEAMNMNSTVLAQNGGNYYDWIELKNNGKEAISLKDYSISTSDTKQGFVLPDITLNPGEYYVVMASGDTNLSNTSYTHMDFKLGEVESIFLWNRKKIIDSMVLFNKKPNISYGRGEDSGFYYMESPSPGSNNQQGVMEISYTPVVSVTPGIYNNVENISVEIRANGTIYYTLDGSMPTNRSSVYNGPISLNQTTVLKAVSYEDGKLSSLLSAQSYIINENHTLPVLSVSMNPSSFSSVQAYTWNTEYETEAYAELYEDGKSFSIPCGFKLFGGSTRGMAKKSFQLKFRKKYGAGTLHYQVFDSRDFSSFNTLVLRSGSQDSEHAFMRDMLATSLVDGKTELDVQAYKTVLLYINGKYWGVYNIREKVEAEFVENHYNVDGDQANIMRLDNDVTCGSSKGYTDLMNYISTHDLSNDANYEYVKSKINLKSFMDFWAAETYVTNNDIINTRFFSHPSVEDGKWNYIFYDLDFALWNYQVNYYVFQNDPEGMSDFKISTFLMRNLMKNKNFQKEYVERISYNLKEVWNQERVLKKIDELYEMLLPEMERNQKRWGSSLSEWQEEVETLRTYVRQREKYMVSHTKSFFRLTNSEVEKYFGG